ncbi:MAG: hypothetical protein IKU16_06055 [Muribaculaceae bacterium]|nr:hypothetical protein [Muribaculaceae bacterium]
MENIEKKVTDAILQRAESFVLDGVEYTITPPTPATLILISELVSTMPVVDRKASNILYEVLATAKDLSVIGKIVATLILGAKRIKERRYVTIQDETETKRWSWKRLRFVTSRTTIETKVLEIDYLAERLLNEVTNEALVNIVSKRLGMMQIGDFFELTTSLSEANQLKRTKEVVATQSGE